MGVPLTWASQAKFWAKFWAKALGQVFGPSSETKFLGRVSGASLRPDHAIGEANIDAARRWQPGS